MAEYFSCVVKAKRINISWKRTTIELSHLNNNLIKDRLHPPEQNCPVGILDARAASCFYFVADACRMFLVHMKTSELPLS